MKATVRASDRRERPRPSPRDVALGSGSPDDRVDLGDVGGGPAGEREGHDAGHRRATRPDQQGSGQPQGLDQDESGDQGADDRADRVGGVQPPERLAQVLVRA